MRRILAGALFAGVIVLAGGACEAPPVATTLATDGATFGAFDGSEGPDADGAPGDAAGDSTDAGPEPRDAPPPPLGRIVLNEAMPQPPDGEHDWFEVMALGAGPTELSTYTIVDADPEHRPVPLPARLMQPGDLLRIWATDSPTAGTLSVPVKLGRTDGLTLYRQTEGPNALRWSTSQVGEARSVGRLPDGEGPETILQPTPGAPNVAFEAPQTLLETEGPVDVDLRFEATEYEALLFGEPGTWAAALTLGEGESLVVEVERDAPADPENMTFTLSLDPARMGVSVDGYRSLSIECPDDPLAVVADVFGLGVAHAAGVVAPRATVASLHLQDEAPRLCALREALDADFVSRRFEDETASLFSASPPASDLVFRGRRAEDNPGIVPIAPETADPTDVFVLTATLNAGDPAAYPSVLALDETLAHLALSSALLDLTSYAGAGSRLWLLSLAGHIIPVSAAMPGTLGAAGCPCGAGPGPATLLGRALCGPLASRPLLRRLLELPELRDRFMSQLRALLERSLSPEAATARLGRVVVAAAATGAGPGFEAIAAAMSARLEARLADVARQISVDWVTIDPVGACE